MKRKSAFIKKGTVGEQNTLAKFGIFKKANVTKKQEEESTLYTKIKEEKTEDIEAKTKSGLEPEKDVSTKSIVNDSNNNYNKSGVLAANINNDNNEKKTVSTKTEYEKIEKMEKCKTPNSNQINEKKRENLLLPLHKQIEPVIKEEFFHEVRCKKNPLLLQLLNEDLNFNLIIHGPPGSGKSSLINVIKNKTNNCFVNLLHMNNFNNEMRKVYDQSLSNFKMSKKKTIVCVKDIHRLNKTQQDSLLLILKKGYVLLLATCLESPVNNLNASLLSRCVLLYLPSYKYEESELILKRAMNRLNVKLDNEAMKAIIDHSSGDARVAISILDFAKKAKSTINTMNESYQKKETSEEKEQKEEKETCGLSELLATLEMNGTENLNKNSDENVDEKVGENIVEKEADKDEKESISVDDVKKVLQNFPSTDKKLDHYGLISALHKSIRAGDTKAAILYLMKSLQNGEDPLYICRRLIRIASEDIGLANHDVLSVCVNTHYACKAIGMPECQTSLIYAVLVLCKSSKSNYVYLVSDCASKICEDYNFTVPFHLKYSDKYIYTNQPEILTFDEHIKKYKNVQKYLPSHMEDVKMPPSP